MEKEYIKYLIENSKLIDTTILDSYFLNNDFDFLLESIDVTKCDILSYKNFIKSKKIDDILG